MLAKLVYKLIFYNAPFTGFIYIFVIANRLPSFKRAGYSNNILLILLSLVR
jgi:hypothetical protein